MLLLIGSASAQTATGPCIGSSPSTITAVEGEFSEYSLTFTDVAGNAILDTGQYSLEYLIYYNDELIPQDSLSLYINTNSSYIVTRLSMSSYTGERIQESHGHFPSSRPFDMMTNIANQEINYFYGQYLKDSRINIKLGLYWLRSGDYRIEIKLMEMTGGTRNNQLRFKGIYIGGNGADPTNEEILSTALVTTKQLSPKTVYVCFNEITNDPETSFTLGNQTWLSSDTWGNTVENTDYCTKTVQFITHDDCIDRLDSVQEITVGRYPQLTASIQASGHNQTICIETSAGYAILKIEGGKAPFSIQPMKNGETHGTPINVEQEGENIKVGGLSAGTYTFVVTDANGCSATTATSITIADVTNNNEITIALNPSHVTCYGGSNGSITATVTDASSQGTAYLPLTYAWSNQTSTTSSELTASISNLTAGTYTLVVTDNMGCTASKNIEITSAPAITTTDAVTCCASELVNGYHYPSQPDTVFYEAGTKQVKFQAANGCDSIVSVTLTVLNPSVELTNITGNSTICAGSGATLSVGAIADGTNGELSYAWSNNRTQDTWNTASITVTPTDTTVYTVVATATLGTGDNACTATATKSFTVNVNAPAVVLNEISGTTTICSGGSTDLSISTTTGTKGTVTYVWNTQETDNTITVSPTSNTTYIVTATATVGEGNEACFVTASKSVEVTVNTPAVQLADMDPVTICQGGNGTTLSVEVIADGTNGELSYAWSNNRTQDTWNTTSITVNPSDTTVYTVEVTATVGNCTASDSKSVTVNVNAPAIALNNITGTTTICNGGSTELSVAPVANNTYGTVTYEWKEGNTTIDNEHDASITVNPTENATYTVVATATVGTGEDACTKTATKEVMVTVNAPAVQLADMDPVTICQGGQGTTLTIGTINDGTNGTLSYAWSAGNTPIDDNDDASLFVNPTSTTTYTVVVTATVDDNDVTCTATASKSVTVTVNAPAVTLSEISGNTVICNGSSTNLSVTASNVTGEVSYAWRAGNTAIANSNSASIIVSPTDTTVYTVEATATVGDCPFSVSKSVTVNVNSPAIVLGDITGETTICNGGSTTLSVAPVAANTHGTVTYAWSNQQTGNTITVSPTSNTTYIVTATATVGEGNEACYVTASKSVTITVNKPSVELSDITGTDRICSGNSTTLTVEAETSNGTVSYVWSAGDQIISTNTPNSITVSPDETTEYTVVATATLNTNNVTCTTTASESVTVIVNPSVTLSSTHLTQSVCAGTDIEDVVISYSNSNITTSALPDGLTFDNNTISGAPTAANYYEIVITATSNQSNPQCAVKRDTLKLTVNPTVTLEATNLTQRVCAGSDITDVVITNTHSTISVSGIAAGLSLDNNTISGAPIYDDEYEIVITATSDQSNPQCAAKKDTLKLTVDPAVELSAVADNLNQTVCAGEGNGINPVTITYDNATLSFSYTKDDNDESQDGLPAGLSFTNGAIAGIPTTAGEYVITITATSNLTNPVCEPRSITFYLTVNPVITLSVTNRNQTVCAGTDITDVVITNTNSEINTSTLPAGLSIEENTISGTPTNAGYYEIVIIASNAETDCLAKKDTFKLTVNPTVTLSATNLEQTVCAGTAINNVVITNANSTVTTSTLPDGLAFSNNTISGTPTTAGEYEIVITATSNQTPACDPEEITFNLTVNPTVTLTASNNLTQSVCAGSAITNVVITNTNSTVTTSTLPAGLTFSNNTIAGTPTTAGEYTITITATSNQEPACTAETVTFNLTVKALPTPTLSNATICASTSDINNTLTLTTDANMNGYTWSVDGGNITEGAETNTIKVNWATAGEKSISITYTNPTTHCAGTAEKTVTVYAAPDFTLTSSVANNSICANEGSDVITISSNGQYSYNWSAATGLDMEDIAGNNNAKEFKSNTAGSYEVTIIGSETHDNLACQTTQNVTVTVNAQPTVTLTPTDPTCHDGNNGKITTSVNGGTPTYTFEWDDQSHSTSNILTGVTAGTYSVTVTDANNCHATEQATLNNPSALVATRSGHTDVDCHGNETGAFTVTATAGTGTPFDGGKYLYQLNGDQEGEMAVSMTYNGLAAGNYEVIVSDRNGCEVTVKDTIREPEELTFAKGDSTNITCHGENEGSITVIASNGTTPYQYKLDGEDTETDDEATNITFDELAAGPHTVTLTDNCGVEKSVTFILTEPAELSLAKGDSTNITCHGASTGTVSVTASNGTEPYQYKIDNGSYGYSNSFEGLAAGTHTVTVKDNCNVEKSVTFTLTEPAELALAITNSSNLTCNESQNGSITVTASNGTANYQYKIDNENYGEETDETIVTFSNLAAGEHTITVMDACEVEKSASITLTQPNALTITESGDAHQDVSCYNGTNGSVTVNVSGGTSTYQYKVGLNGTYGTATDETSFTYANRPAEKDTIYVKDINGCEASVPVEITQPAQLTLTEASHVDVACYGNATGEITVSATGGVPTYLYKWDNGNYGGSEHKDGLTAGGHSIVVKDGNNCTATLTVEIAQPEAALSATLKPTDVSCYGYNDGAIDVTVQGGTPTYSFTWNDQSHAEDRTELTAGTYTVTITDAHYCTLVKSVTLEQPAAFTVAITSDDDDNEICENEKVTFTATTTGDIESLQWQVNGNDITDSTRNELIINTAGSYTVVATQENSGCTVTSNAITLTVDTVPNVTITGPSSVCDGENFELTAHNANHYVWSDGTNPIETVEEETLVANGEDIDESTTYYVTGTNSYGCTASASKTITVNALPSTDLTIFVNGEDFGATGEGDDVLLCAGSNVTISVPYVGGNTYAWYTDGGDELLENETGNTLSLNNITESGSYFVIVTAATGCEGWIEPVDVIVNALPTVTLSEDNDLDAICADSAFHFTAACATTVTYAWKYNNAAINGANTAALRATEAGKYVVNVTDGNGCSNVSDTLTVTVNALPTVTLSEDNNLDAICADSAFHFTAACETAETYAWKYNNAALDGANTAALRATEAGKYVVNVTDGNGCSNVSDTLVVIVNALPDFYLSSSTNDNEGDETGIAVCYGTEVTLQADHLLDAETYTYTWSTSNYLSGEENDTRTFSDEAPAGIYTINVTATNDLSGCKNTQSHTITVNALPTFTVANNEVCLGGTVALNVTGSNENEYVWTPIEYFVEPNSELDEVTGTSATFHGTEAGEKVVTVTGTDDNGCTNTATATVTVRNLPTEGLTALEDKEICQGATASWTIANGNYTSYEWSSTLEGSLGDNTTSNSITFTGSTTGTYSVTVEVTDNNGCTNSASANVVVDTLPVITLSSETAVCQNGDIIFTTTAATADNGIHGYVWTYPTANATVTGETDGNTLTVKWSDYGNKIVRVNYTDGNNCTATQPASKTIAVNELPNVIITNGEAATICLGETVNLTADGATTYEWANNAGNEATITVEPKRDSTFTVTGTDANGCSNTASIDFIVNDTVKLTISNNSQTICLGQPIEAIEIAYEAATLNTITYCEGLSYNSETGKVTGTPTAAGTYNYTITATSDETPSCGSKSENITIVVNDTVKLTVTPATQTLCLGTAITPIVLDTAHCDLDFGDMPEELSYNATAHQIEGRLTEAGTYNFTVTATNGCGTKTQNVSIIVNDTVKLTVTNATQELCLGTPITTIEIEAENGTVSFVGLPAELSANSDNSAITGELTTAGEKTFTIKATSTTCPSTDKSVEVSITMNDTVKFNATDLSQELCLGASITPIVLDTAHCTLNFGDMPEELSYNETSHQIEGRLIEANEYEFTITATNGCGTKTKDVSITVNDTVSLTVTPATQTLCLGTPITTIEIEAENGTVSFVGLPTGLSANSDNSAITGELTTAGTHTFTVKASSDICPSTDKSVEVSITMNDTVELVALSPADNFSQEFCKGTAMAALNFRINNADDVELTGAPEGVTLEAVTATSATQPNYVMSGTPTATGTFNFTITASSEACEASVKTFNGTIIVDTIPAVTITTNANNNTICAGDTITMTATAGYTSYSWSNQATGSSIEIVPSADATNYTVTVTNGEGCSNTATINITINALPTVTISEEHGLSTICADSAFHFIVNCTTAVEYLWSDESEGSTLRATEAGEYFVAVTDANGCTNESNTLTVTVNALPVVTTTHENVSCTELGSATITVTSEGTGFTCAWNNAQTATLTEQNDDELYFITFDELNGGDYPFIITDSKGCSKKDTITIDNPGSISATQSIVNAYSCEGTENLLSFEIVGGNAEYTIEWVNVENEQIVADTIVTTQTAAIDMDFLRRGDYNLTMIIEDRYGCRGTSDTVSLTVWPSYHIVREISAIANETTYTYNGVTYNIDEKPATESHQTANGCDSIIEYEVTPYGLQILVADTCYLTRSSYTRPYSNTPENLIDTIYVKKNAPTYFYAYIEDTDSTKWNEERMDMRYELLYNEESIDPEEMPNLVTNFSISSYYDRSGVFYGINNLQEPTGEIPANTLAFRQTANSTIMQFDFFYFAAFKNIPNKVTFTGLENGTYTLKLKAELRTYNENAEENEELGINRNGIFNPYVVGRKYGHVWGGYGDLPIGREVIASRSFTIIVNEDGVNPNAAPTAISEYSDEASVRTYPNPVNDQLNLCISGMSGQTVITITDAQGKVVRVINTDLSGSTETLTYSVADFAQGMYFLNVRNNDTVVSQKFVVTRR